MSGSAGLFNNFFYFFLPRREPKGGRSGRWGKKIKIRPPLDIYIDTDNNIITPLNKQMWINQKSPVFQGSMQNCQVKIRCNI